MGSRWYVAQTHPNAEAAAERRLKRQRFATYLPRCTTRAWRYGKVVEHVRPCFPGYLFVRLDLDGGEAWKAACYTRGVLRLLPVSDNPIAVKTDEVMELHQAELDGALVSGLVAPGAKLRVYRGALARQVVQCLAVDDHRGRVLALWQCFGREVRVKLRLSEVTVLR
jgi:transcriptional antiterminator RfaH